MSEQAYIASTREALMAITLAINEAKELMTDAVRIQYWVSRKLSPTPWESVQHWYQGQEDFNHEIADGIAALMLLHRARESLHSVVVTPQPGSETRLKLAKVRRIS